MKSNSKFAFDCISILNEEKKYLKDLLEKEPTAKKIQILITTRDITCEKFVNNKYKILTELGLNVIVTKLLDAKKNDIQNWLRKTNNDKKTLGIVVQYPVSINNRVEIMNTINKYKDLDALNQYWKLVLKQNGYTEPYLMPPTVFALKKILDLKQVFLRFLKLDETTFSHSVIKKLIFNHKDLKFHVIGDSDLIGQPIIDFLKWNNYSNSFSNIFTPERVKNGMIKEADIIITTTGSINAVNEKIFSNGQVVIDFGRSYHNGKVCGDVKNGKLDYGVVHTKLFNSTGIATIAGIIRNIRVLIKNAGFGSWK